MKECLHKEVKSWYLWIQTDEGKVQVSICNDCAKIYAKTDTDLNLFYIDSKN